MWDTWSLDALVHLNVCLLEIRNVLLDVAHDIVNVVVVLL